MLQHLGGMRILRVPIPREERPRDRIPVPPTRRGQPGPLDTPQHGRRRLEMSQCLLAEPVRTPSLASRGAVRVEGALPEAKGALLVAELVGRDAQLRVLEAHVEAREAHLLHVDVVVGGEVGEGVEEVSEVGRVRGLGVLRVEGEVRVAVEGEGDHGDGPAAEADGGEGLALGVEVGDEARRHVPVAPEVEVLDGVHGEVLELVEREMRGEEVQAQDGPVDVLRSLLTGVVGTLDRIVQILSKLRALVDPFYKESKHGRRFTREPE